MSDVHDSVVTHVAKYRFPFPGQTTWPADYVTLTNAPDRKRAIETKDGPHYPDILIIDGTGRPREIGEVETTLDPGCVAHWKLSSEAADTDTPTKVRHFFLYVPAGQEASAQAMLEDAGVSYAGVRGYSIDGAGKIEIVPFATKGDQYDHQ